MSCRLQRRSRVPWHLGVFLLILPFVFPSAAVLAQQVPKSSGARCVIVCPDRFSDAAEALQEFHHGMGLAPSMLTEVVTVEWIDAHATPQGANTTFTGYWTAGLPNPPSNYDDARALSILGFLRDCADGDGNPDDAYDLDWPNLEYVVLLGRAVDVPPSFYYYDQPEDVWIASDFFYSTQGPATAYDTVPKYRVGRIPAETESEAFAYVQKCRNWYDGRGGSDKGARDSDAFADWFTNTAVFTGGNYKYAWDFSWVQSSTAWLMEQQFDLDGDGTADTDLFNSLHFKRYVEHNADTAQYDDRESLTNVERHLAGQDYARGGAPVNTGLAVNVSHGLVDLFGTHTDEGDIDIDRVDSWTDPGHSRLPFLITISCLNGQYDLSARSAGDTQRCIASEMLFAGLDDGGTEDEPEDDASLAGPIAITAGSESCWAGTGANLTTEGEYRFNEQVFSPEIVADWLERYQRSDRYLGALFWRGIEQYRTDNGMADQSIETWTILEMHLFGDPVLPLPLPPTASQREANGGEAPVVEFRNYKEGSFGENSVMMRVFEISPEDQEAVIDAVCTNRSDGDVRWHIRKAQDDYHLSVDDDGAPVDEFTSNHFEQTAKKPTVYAVTVASNHGVLDAWQKERYYLVQVVNEFRLDPDTRVLVIDACQHDRYYLGGTHHDPKRGTYFVDPRVDLNPAADPGYGGITAWAGASDHRGALAWLNHNVVDEDGDPTMDYMYQVWDIQPWVDGLDIDPSTGSVDEVNESNHFGEIDGNVLDQCIQRNVVVIWHGGDASWEWWNNWAVTMTGPDTYVLEDFLNRGGKLLVGDQVIPHNIGSWDFHRDYLRAVVETAGDENTGVKSLEGLFPDTFSARIHDLYIGTPEGEPAWDYDGADNANRHAEITVQSEQALAWTDLAGPDNVVTPERAAAVQHIFAGGGQVIYLPWPFEAIDRGGTLERESDDDDARYTTAGRYTLMYEMLSWLRDPPEVAGRAGAGANGGGGGGGTCTLVTVSSEDRAQSSPGVCVEDFTGRYRLPPERARDLDLVRRLRDDVLLRTGIGRHFVAWYYAMSPTAACAIREHESAKSAVRALIVRPLVTGSRALLGEPQAGTGRADRSQEEGR